MLVAKGFRWNALIGWGASWRWISIGRRFEVRRSFGAYSWTYRHIRKAPGFMWLLDSFQGSSSGLSYEPSRTRGFHECYLGLPLGRKRSLSTRHRDLSSYCSSSSNRCSWAPTRSCRLCWTAAILGHRYYMAGDDARTWMAICANNHNVWLIIVSNHRLMAISIDSHISLGTLNVFAITIDHAYSKTGCDSLISVVTQIDSS